IRKLGFDNVLNYKCETFNNDLSKERGMFTHILDTVGGSNLNENLELLSRKGKLLLIGLLGGVKAEINLSMFLSKNLTMHSSTLRSQSVELKASLLEFIASSILPGMGKNPSAFYPSLDKVFNFRDVFEAFN